MRFDSSIKYAEYKLYQFDGDTLNAETAEVLVSGGLYRSQTNQTLYVGVGRLKVGSKLQLVLNTLVRCNGINRNLWAVVGNQKCSLSGHGRRYNSNCLQIPCSLYCSKSYCA